MMNVAKGLGYDAIFLSARRERGLAETEEYSGHRVKRIGPFFPLLNGKAAFLYLRSIMKFNRELYREFSAQKPELVHCSDIETMPAGVLYRWKSRARLIYNIHDNLAQRYELPRFAQGVLNILEGAAVNFSSLALVPEEFRKQALPRWCQSKVEVVRNTPEDRGVFAPPCQLEPIRIFFGGWLDPGRGLLQLLDLVRFNKSFELTLAGEGSPELIAAIKSNPRTKFLGFVTHEEIMRETANAHIVAALYDPARPINRYAASNKLAEALSCGRPVLVNSEMLITESLQEYDCLVKLPYAEFEAHAAEILRDMMADGGGRYAAKCRSARAAYEALYTWEEAQRVMIASLGEKPS